MFPNWCKQGKDYMGLYLDYLTTATPLLGIIFALFVVFYSESPIFMALKILPSGLSENPWIKFGLVLVSFWCGLYGIYGVLMVSIFALMYVRIMKLWMYFIAVFIPSSLFDQKSVSIKKSYFSSYSHDRMESMISLTRQMYSIQRLHCILFNLLVNEILPLATGFLGALHVLSAFVMVRLYTLIGMPYYLLFPTINIFFILMEIVLFSGGAKMFSFSETFLIQWKLHGDIYMRKWVMAVKHVEMPIGPFFVIKRGTILTFMSLIIGHTINLVLGISL